MKTNQKVTMKNLTILKYPDDSLRDVAAKVIDFESELVAETAASLGVLVRGDNVLGVAATQIGVPLRIFAMRVNKFGGRGTIHCVNPEITIIPNESGHITQSLRYEACLSLPSTHKVPRWDSVMLKFSSVDGKFYQTIKLYGLEAHVAQHELDHLHGILISDYKYVTEL